MKSLLVFIFNPIFIFSLIQCNIIPTTIYENQLEKITLVQNENLLLLGSFDNSSKMIIDIMLSHPSKFILTFNQYSANYDDSLSPDFNKNQTNLNIKEKNNYFGKSRIILDLPKNENDTKNQILVNIKKIDNSINITKNEEDDKYITMRYIISENDEEYQFNNTEIKIQECKDGFNISFGGIKEEKDLTNISATYTIDICEKNILESQYENIYFYSFSEKNLSLFHKETKIEGNNIKNDNYIEIKSLLDKKKKYFLFLNVNIQNYILQYKVEVLEISKKIEPEIDAEKNRKKNRSILILILSCFGGIVILTYIMVLIYLFVNKKPGLNKNVEQDYDYKNIGEIKTLNEDEA